ncbi:PPC domain-containing DNA-binding protein [Methanolobus bombayensis]|uniref:PPC domain-containing DNA-binding protein n=1 Tax=Methanolobus bombayensis TaxID=38023 RepID=UPI001AE5A8B9|nr:PPC domain-containing DNA-binding protein [Methanolobus bombayensis]MBP1909808.1 putative DNA-binding protein with PD1-like motif [Methanolobus bombayensis]
MEYSQGNIGRVFTVRLDQGDDILKELEGLAVSEDIRSAMFMMLGAVKEANLVVGPKENIVPPDPQWSRLRDVHELIGIGNIFREYGTGKPKIHLHSAAGRGESTKTGCLRESSEVFMVVEIFIMEISGISASRIFDPDRGFAPVSFPDES